MCGRKLADPVNIETFAALRFNRGPRPRSVVPPDRCRGEIPMQLLLELNYLDLNDLTRIACGVDYTGNGERINIARQFHITTYRSWRGHRLSKSWEPLAEGD